MSRSNGTHKSKQKLISPPHKNGVRNSQIAPVHSGQDDAEGDGDAYITPRMPVVFVLGGPGSGKITHSETLTRRAKGYVHINMTDLLQGLIEETEVNDIGAVPTSQTLHVLMAALKAQSNIYGYLVSGFPRNMRDATEYISKIGRCDGVIMLNWLDMTLERQIEYGARLGEIDLDLAKIELRNFRRHVIPVCEYFDYKQLLYVVSNCTYSRLRLIEPPWDRPYLALISGVSYYPVCLFSKNSEFITKGGSNKRRELLTGELLTEVYCITIMYYSTSVYSRH